MQMDFIEEIQTRWHNQQVQS